MFFIHFPVALFAFFDEVLDVVVDVMREFLELSERTHDVVVLVLVFIYQRDHLLQLRIVGSFVLAPSLQQKVQVKANFDDEFFLYLVIRLRQHMPEEVFI